MFQILSIWINARGISNLQKELPKVIYEGSTPDFSDYLKSLESRVTESFDFKKALEFLF